MTNLTSEQYRDVIKNVQNCTEEIPSIQHLLHKAVITFFDKYGAYPEMAGVAPGKVGLFGEQTQFDNGLVWLSSTPMATIVVGRKVLSRHFTVVTSSDVGKPHKVKFSFSRHRPLGPGCPIWLNYVKGIIDNYPETVPPFEAAIESSIPMGVGFGSASAIETAFYSFLEVLVGKKANPIEKAKACQKAEKDFAFKDVGLADRVTSIAAKDRHTLLMDTRTNDVLWIPFQNSDLALILIDSHEKDKLFGDEYPERSKYIAKACEILRVDHLKECTQQDLEELEDRVKYILEKDTEEGESEEEMEENDEDEEEKGENSNFISSKDKGDDGIWSEEEYNIMMKRAKFFIDEMKRINDAMEAWDLGDYETFGKKMTDSHNSLKEDFDINNPLLDFFVQSSLQVEGVLGSKMIGMGLGFGGGIISLIKKENIEKYCKFISHQFSLNEDQLQSSLHEQRVNDLQKRYENQKTVHSKNNNASMDSSQIISEILLYLQTGKELRKLPGNRSSLEEKDNAINPCILKLEKSLVRCGTWGHHQKSKQEEFSKKNPRGLKRDKKTLRENENSKEAEITTKKEAGRKEIGEGDEKDVRKKGSGDDSEMANHESTENDFFLQLSKIPKPKLNKPTFYIISPISGARMMFVTKTDILRSLYACSVPHPKVLAKIALAEFKKEYGTKPEAIGIAPGNITLFGEFMEIHLGHIICMNTPMVTVTVGGRNDSIKFSVKTLSKDVEKPNIFSDPLPSVRHLHIENREWVNLILGCVNEFKGHVPGFNAVIHSSIPIKTGFNSCSALQSSLYTFLEDLTGNCTTDLFEKADRCGKSEYEFSPEPSELVTRCSKIKFFPTFMCKDGHLLYIDCKRFKMSQYFFDHPSYVFLVGTCKHVSNNVTVQSLEERLKKCMEALDILGRNSLLNTDIKHLRCLRKRDASEETIRRVRYVITEHQRTVEAIKAIKNEDYERVGMLMNKSHVSLRDDYQVSSPEIEKLISLARSVDGVLGAKMLGKGLNSTVIILLKISEVEKCIRHMKKNYEPQNDRPDFYIIKPSGRAFMMNPDVELPYIP